MNNAIPMEASKRPLSISYRGPSRKLNSNSDDMIDGEKKRRKYMDDPYRKGWNGWRDQEPLPSPPKKKLKIKNKK